MRARVLRRLSCALRKTGDRLCSHARCDECPLGWEERGMEDCDAGCLLYGDLYEGSAGCYLPLPVKNLIAGFIRRRNDRQMEKAYEGMGEWFARSEALDQAMLQAIREQFPDMDPDLEQAFSLRVRYEDICEEKGLTEREDRHGKKPKRGRAA